MPRENARSPGGGFYWSSNDHMHPSSAPCSPRSGTESSRQVDPLICLSSGERGHVPTVGSFECSVDAQSSKLAARGSAPCFRLASRLRGHYGKRAISYKCSSLAARWSGRRCTIREAWLPRGPGFPMTRCAWTIWTGCAGRRVSLVSTMQARKPPRSHDGGRSCGGCGPM